MAHKIYWGGMPNESHKRMPHQPTKQNSRWLICEWGQDARTHTHKQRRTHTHTFVTNQTPRLPQARFLSFCLSLSFASFPSLCVPVVSYGTENMRVVERMLFCISTLTINHKNYSNRFRISSPASFQKVPLEKKTGRTCGGCWCGVAWSGVWAGVEVCFAWKIGHEGTNMEDGDNNKI